MRIVTKHAGACVAIATHPEHKYVYSSGAEGAVHVLCDSGEQVLSKLRQGDGSDFLAMAMSGTRLVGLTDKFTTLIWRDVKTEGATRFPPGGRRTVPDKRQALCMTTVASDHLVAVACSGGLLWVCQWGRGAKRTQKIVREARYQMPGSPIVTAIQYVNATGTMLAVGRLIGGRAADRRSALPSLLSIYDGVPTSSTETHLICRFDVDLDSPAGCIAQTEKRVVYAGLENGTLLKLDLREYTGVGRPPARQFVSIPQSPLVTAIAVSPCGRFVAVGADFGDYGGVLLYDADLKPLAMFDTSSEPYALAFHQPWMPDDPPPPTLFSGHFGGQVIKWHISRQLTWMSLVAAPPRPTTPAYDPTAEVGHSRAIDL